MSWQQHREDAIRAEPLAGATVLDVGGYDGGVAFACLGWGAARAVCVDSGQWTIYGWGAPERFDGVEYVEMDVLDYAAPADLVVASNVVYHQRNPWRFCEHLRALTRGRLVLVTSFVPGEESCWRVYRPGEGHPVSTTVAWRPMVPGLIALLEAVGFVDVAEVGREGDHVVVRAR